MVLYQKNYANNNASFFSGMVQSDDGSILGQQTKIPNLSQNENVRNLDNDRLRKRSVYFVFTSDYNEKRVRWNWKVGESRALVESVNIWYYLYILCVSICCLSFGHVTGKRVVEDFRPFTSDVIPVFSLKIQGFFIRKFGLASVLKIP